MDLDDHTPGDGSVEDDVRGPESRGIRAAVRWRDAGREGAKASEAAARAPEDDRADGAAFPALTEASEDPDLVRQRKRQRAYRKRLKEKGLREFRYQLDPKHHDTLRDLAQRIGDGELNPDAAFQGPTKPRPRWGWALLGAMGGALAGAGLVLWSSAGGMHAVNDLVRELRGEIVRLELERDGLHANLQATRREAVRAVADQAAVKSLLVGMNLDIGSLKDHLAGARLESLGDRPLDGATPPGPRFVPNAAKDSAAQGPAPPEVAHLPPTLALYAFQFGDTVESVAARFGLDPEALRAANLVLRAPPWRYGDRIVVPITPTAGQKGAK